MRLTTDLNDRRRCSKCNGELRELRLPSMEEHSRAVFKCMRARRSSSVRSVSNKQYDRILRSAPPGLEVGLDKLERGSLGFCESIVPRTVMPGFIKPQLATLKSKRRQARIGFTKSNTTATEFNCTRTAGTSVPSPETGTIGFSGSRWLPVHWLVLLRPLSTAK